MNNEENNISAEMIISINGNGDIELSYSGDLSLNERISILTQTLQHEVDLYVKLCQLDENRNLIM